MNEQSQLIQVVVLTIIHNVFLCIPTQMRRIQPMSTEAVFDLKAITSAAA
jgi:hypothetical protein